METSDTAFTQCLGFPTKFWLYNSKNKTRNLQLKLWSEDWLEFFCTFSVCSRKEIIYRNLFLVFASHFHFFPQYLSFPSLFSLFLPFKDAPPPNPVLFTAYNVCLQKRYGNPSLRIKVKILYYLLYLSIKQKQEVQC